MARVSITRQQARRFLIRRQSYRAYGSDWTGLDDVGTALRHLGAVQIDPVLAFERNHHHALFCRVNGYRSEMLETALYERREGFEYYCNALCMLPMAEYPYFRYRMRQMAKSYAVQPDVLQASERVLKGSLLMAPHRLRSLIPVRESAHGGTQMAKRSRRSKSMRWTIFTS